MLKYNDICFLHILFEIQAVKANLQRKFIDEVSKMTCCFFGHNEIPSGLSNALEPILETLICEGADDFLIGHQGGFDHAVLHLLRRMKEKYPSIQYHVVLAYLPREKEEFSLYAAEETLYPEGLESIHPRFAISWRNKWMINESETVVTYVTHSWGGAAQFAELAKKKGKRIINVAEKTE